MARKRLSRLERRVEIIEAAGSVMLKKGFRATTTRDVTTSIGVGSGLLNHYFPWAELRRLAFEHVARQATTMTFEELEELGPRRVMKRFIADTFSAASRPYMRVWLEAADEAVADRKLARSVDRCASEFRQELERLIRLGNEQTVWVCADPKGASWRILAAHDGLIGFVIAGAPRLSRTEAAKHLEVVITNECRPT